MGEQWLEIEEAGRSRRVALKSGLTRLGGPGADYALGAWEGGELHFWDSPPRVVHSGGGGAATINGRDFEECSLAPGDHIHWGVVVVRFGSEGANSVLEEIPPEPARVRAPRRERTVPDARLARWLWAGLLVEQGLAPRTEAKRWQEAVLRNEFDPDACARDVLGERLAEAEDPRLGQRAARLMRDLVMAPVAQGMRGTGRRMRGAAKGGTAFVLVQVLALLVYTAIILVIMLLVRVKWEFSFDGLLDGFLRR